MPDFKQLSRSVKGLTVLVTGAASGMGRATARVFAAEGANVAVTDVTEQGVPFSLDGYHISIFGSKSAAQAFARTKSYQALMERIAAAHRSLMPSNWPYRQKFSQAASM